MITRTELKRLIKKDANFKLNTSKCDITNCDYRSINIAVINSKEIKLCYQHTLLAAQYQSKYRNS